MLSAHGSLASAWLTGRSWRQRVEQVGRSNAWLSSLRLASCFSMLASVLRLFLPKGPAFSQPWCLRDELRCARLFCSFRTDGSRQESLRLFPKGL
ncbi:hypothetical protein D3C73_1226150 [compost metagenome]